MRPARPPPPTPRRRWLLTVAAVTAALLLLLLSRGAAPPSGDRRLGEFADGYTVPLGIYQYLASDADTAAREKRLRHENTSVYDSPSVIPPKVQRLLMNPRYTMNISHPRRTFSRPRFPPIDEVFARALDIPALVQAAAAAAVAADTPSQPKPCHHILYTVSRAKALYTSLRGLMDDTLHDRVATHRDQGPSTDAEASRFIVLELTDSGAECEAHPSSPQPPRAPPVLLLLNELPWARADLRALTIDAAAVTATTNSAWQTHLQRPATRAMLAAARAGAGPTASGNAHCHTTGTSAETNEAGVGWGIYERRQGGRRDTLRGGGGVGAGATAVRGWAWGTEVASPLHAVMRIRAGGLARDVDRAQERAFAQSVRRGAGPEFSGRAGGTGGTSWRVDPRTVTHVAHAMRPLVDVQVISSFDVLYDRLVDREARNHTGRPHREQADGEAGTGAPAVGAYRSHFLVGDVFRDTQEEFEAFLVFLLRNAKEATYLELPNLFACVTLHSSEGAVRGATSRLARRLYAWYVEPLLRGRQTPERSADGRYNAEFMIGRGYHARREAKNRRIASMGDLLEAILLSYGLYADVTLVYEDPTTLGYCFPNSTAARAARWSTGDPASTSPPMPRVIYQFSPDRLQMKRQAVKKLLVERLDCATLWWAHATS